MRRSGKRLRSGDSINYLLFIDPVTACHFLIYFSFSQTMKSPACKAGDFLYCAGLTCIIPAMNIPDHIVTQVELKRNTGQRGTKKFIAYQGIVYDVTDCPKWRTDLHEQLHFPGQDLTSELPEAPHQEEVFSRPCVKVVGRLQTI